MVASKIVRNAAHAEPQFLVSVKAVPSVNLPAHLLEDQEGRP